MSLLLRLLPQSGRTQLGSNLYNSKKWTDPTRVRLISPQSGRIPPRVNTVLKVDGSHQGSTRFTKWTDPTKIKLISPQSGRIPPRVNTVHKWTDPTRVKLISPQSRRIPPRVNTTVHEVDGPNQGQIYTIPKNGRTQQGSNLYNSKKRTDPTIGQHQSTKWTNATIVELTPVHKVDGPYQRFKTPIHIMDGPNQFIKLYKSTKWTAIRGHDHIPRNGRTQLGSQTL